MPKKNEKKIEKMKETFDKLLKFAEESDGVDAVKEEFDKMLDELLMCDFFGTEGQFDPRKDRRG